MSRVLIGSISRSMPHGRRLRCSPCEVGDDRPRAARARSTPAGSDAGHHMHARAAQRVRVGQRLLEQPRRNSSSRPGRQARPRSPASQSPGGALNSTCVQAVRRPGAPRVRGGRVRRGTGTRPLEAVAPPRRRSGRGRRARCTSSTGWRQSAASRSTSGAEGARSSSICASSAARPAAGQQPQPRCLLQLFERRPSRRPAIRARPLGPSRSSITARIGTPRRAPGDRRATHRRRRIARAVIRISGTWPTFITKYGVIGGSDVAVAPARRRSVSATQVGAVGVDHAARRRRRARRCVGAAPASCWRGRPSAAHPRRRPARAAPGRGSRGRRRSA